MNADKYFLDTNVFVYCFEPSQPAKLQRAVTLVSASIASGAGVISDQVAQEFCNAALGKARNLMSSSDAERYLNDVLGRLIVVQSSLVLLREGIRLHHRYQLNWYDSLIVAAALEARCSILYSEDFQHGARFDTVRVVNPFL